MEFCIVLVSHREKAIYEEINNSLIGGLVLFVLFKTNNTPNKSTYYIHTKYIIYILYILYTKRNIKETISSKILKEMIVHLCALL